jgi:hypothetical protein
MKITVSLMSGASNTERSVLRAFYQGLCVYYTIRYQVADVQRLKESTGIELTLSYDQEIEPCDIGIQFGSVKDRNVEHHMTRQSVQRNATTVVHIETPVLGRVINDKNQYSHYRVGVGGYLNGQGKFYNESSLDPDRLDQFIKSGIISPFPGWKDHNRGSILILCQLLGDSSMRGQRVTEWLADTVESIRSRTSRPIAIRLHPGMSVKARSEFFGEMGSMILSNYEKITWRNGLSTTLEKDLSNAGVCVTYTSGSAVDAVLAGVPVIALDEGNFAWPISSHSLLELDSPHLAKSKDVNSWLLRLANSQWSVEEMYNGRVWQHLEPVVERALTK